jgi:hypothetical protein
MVRFEPLEAAVDLRDSCHPDLRSLSWWTSRCCTSRTARAGDKQASTSKRSPRNARTSSSTTRSSTPTKPPNNTDSSARQASTPMATTSSPTLTHQSGCPVASTKHLTDLPAHQPSNNSAAHSARAHNAAQPPARALREIRRDDRRPTSDRRARVLAQVNERRRAVRSSKTLSDAEHRIVRYRALGLHVIQRVPERVRADPGRFWCFAWVGNVSGPGKRAGRAQRVVA